MALEEYRKAAVAAVIALVALAGLFISFDPGVEQAAIGVTLAVFNVASVFMAKNHTVDDISKAVAALQTASLGLVAFFITLDPSTVETISAVVLAVLNVYGVWRAVNTTPRL